ncbi:AMP-binding protein [Trueperella bialowiezensis]|uniref:Long-chain-fatty-acid--CoA ligase n=1 Tax=Trueperella bialowiezensis TaxID=312285 RepID=A0A448PCP6_9ACTO|nr:AMP-binding protein [Trueperella bialowiezensis]VEI12617.1 Long-chain-fatty-acid--CoA ligase [Trueperella bialowiezensis]
MNQMDLAHSHYLDGVATEIEPVTHTVDHLLFSAAKDFPERIAIDFLGREYTYAEVLDEVSRAAQVLKMVGVRRGDVISLILPNCPQHYVAFYAAMSLGVTVAEHNPLAPRAQIDSQIELVGSKVVIGWEQTLEKLIVDGDFKGRTYLAVNLTKALPTKSQWLLKLPVKAARQQRNKLRGKVPAGVHSWDNQVKHNAPLDLSREEGPDVDSLAVLLMTGGTTGTPKAVQLTHRNLLSNTRQVDYWLKDFERGTETVGAVLPFFHAFGLQLSMLVCVNMAATQVMTPTFDVDILFAAHKRHPITFFGGVPPMFQKILDAVDSGKSADLSSIRYAVCGAMPLDPELAARWEEKAGLIIEGYGMTEASPVISGSPVSERRRPSTLGLPFPSTEVKIVDQDDPSIELGEGEIGELCARGPQVFTGYYKNPEETANALRDGWLHTGDLARWDDGFLIMADRRKEMIINSGFNVYPSEVESAVRDMPGVVDVAVVGMPTDSFSESVVAALVLEPGATVDLAAVRKWTEDKLSHYAMPKSIAIFDDLPRSQLGKIMRRNVRERLENFELVSGQWRERAAAASRETAEKLDEYYTAVKERAATAKSSLSALSAHSPARGSDKQQKNKNGEDTQ